MTKQDEATHDVGAPFERGVRPAAWIDANSLRWLKAKPETRSCGTELFGVQQEGQLPLYDQAGLDAAVQAEHDRWIAKAGRVYTDAHAIFNDPPSETPQDVRDVIEWHLASLRA